jgi:hypothetical protein
LWFHRVLAKSLRICTLIIVSHSSSLLDHLSHTPSCDLSSYAAAKRIVSLGAFQTVVVVLVMFAEYCLWRIFLIEAKQLDSYKPRSNILTAALTECQVVFADPKTSHHIPPLWHHQASSLATLLHLCDRHQYMDPNGESGMYRKVTANGKYFINLHCRS